MEELDDKTRRKWLCYNGTLMALAFFTPTIILIEWNFVLLWKQWKYTNASVSRVLAEPTWFPLTLSVNITAMIGFAIPVMARNIQIHVYFVNESFSLYWRYFNVISLILAFIGYIGAILMTIFDVHDWPLIHIITAGILVFGLGFYEMLHAILTLKHRIYVYKNNDNKCKSSWYFIDVIYYIITFTLGIGWTVAYVVAYQTVGNIARATGIDEPFYAYQWIGLWFMLCYPYGFVFTLYTDSTDDEVRLFAKYSYLYITKGLCDVNYGQKMHQTQKELETHTNRL